MGLGISCKEHNLGVIYHAPLRIEDREWVINHLRMMADKIEENPSTILSIGITVLNSYGIPTLEVVQSDTTIDYPPKKQKESGV